VSKKLGSALHATLLDALQAVKSSFILPDIALMEFAIAKEGHDHSFIFI
jgi:hypothetical protein